MKRPLVCISPSRGGPSILGYVENREMVQLSFVRDGHGSTTTSEWISLMRSALNT